MVKIGWLFFLGGGLARASSVGSLWKLVLSSQNCWFGDSRLIAVCQVLTLKSSKSSLDILSLVGHDYWVMKFSFFLFIFLMHPYFKIKLWSALCVFSFGYCRLVCTDTVLQWSSLEEKDSAARFRFSTFDLLWLRHGNLHPHTSTVQMVNILWMQLQLIVLSQLIQTHLPKTLSWMGLETLSVLLFALLHETSVNLKCCK